MAAALPAPTFCAIPAFAACQTPGNVVYLECQQDFYHVMKLSRTPILRKGGFTLIELMVVIAILAALGAMSYGPIMDRMNDGDRQVASNNLKQIHTMLQQFQIDRSTYPCDSTAEELSAKAANDGINFGELSGDTANPYFRQLLIVEKDPSEKVFYAKLNCAGKQMAKEGDGTVANGEALRSKENAMAYVMRKGQEEGVKQGVNKSTAPLVICGIYPSRTPYSGDSLVFDNSSFRGHVFVLSGDGSVKDHDDNLIEDENDDEKATFAEEDSDGKKISLFPQTKRGRDTASDYIILAPEL